METYGISKQRKKTRSPAAPGNRLGNPAHFVQFYDDGAFPAASLAEFLWEGIQAGRGAAMFLTSEHAGKTRRALAGCGAELEDLERDGRLLILDAGATLKKFMVKDRPDPRRFHDVVGSALDRIVAFGMASVVGEIVARLAGNDNAAGALELEGLCISMPGRGGLETLRLLRAEHPRLKIINKMHRNMG